MPTISIEGDEEIIAKLKAFPGILSSNVEGAGKQAAKTILDTEGVRNYPPETEANRAPAPYYIRGQGTQYANGNQGNSERYGTKWNVEASGYKTTIGNTASYSKWLGGEEQAQAMARIGWKKLIDVADQKIEELKRIYNVWIERAKKMAGL